MITAWQSNNDTDELMPCRNPGGQRGAGVCSRHHDDSRRGRRLPERRRRCDFDEKLPAGRWIEQIIDGTSTTFMVAEKHIDRRGLNITGGRDSNNRDGTPFYNGGGGPDAGWGECWVVGTTRNRPLARAPMIT